MSPYSSAQLLFLSKFKSPKSADLYANDESWKEVLEEKPTKTVDRFKRDGLLLETNLEQRIDISFKSTELKEMLKKRGLKQSGRKEEQIARLIEYNRAEMEKTVVKVKGYILSVKGTELAIDYLEREREIRERAEEQVLDFLKKRDFEKAVRTMANYESVQVFPRGMGIDWKRYNPRRDVNQLKYIFSSKPAILKGLDESKFEVLRLAAGVMLLWGKSRCEEWLLKDFTSGFRLDAETAARMFLFFGMSKYELDFLRESRDFIDGIQISAIEDSCRACKGIHARIFKLNNVIELPYENCTHEMGCRCTYLPIVKGLSAPL